VALAITDVLDTDELEVWPLTVWDLASGSCVLTHRGDAAFQCVVATPGGVIASDRPGTIWFLGWARASSPLPRR
jgi:hypothetical protein